MDRTVLATTKYNNEILKFTYDHENGDFVLVEKDNYETVNTYRSKVFNDVYERYSRLEQNIVENYFENEVVE